MAPPRHLRARGSAGAGRSPRGGRATVYGTVAFPRRSATARPAGSTAPLLEVENLAVTFRTPEGPIRAVNGIDLRVDDGEIVGLVGESGCGKSVTALSILGLVPVPPGRFERGAIRFRGEDLLRKSEREMQHIRGNDIAMVFQDPMASLNPVFPVGDQIAEAVELHQAQPRAAAASAAVDALRQVGVPLPEQRAHEYPHQLSGGMRQRVMIAMALSCGPQLLIADEPTTALDVTIQAQILHLLRDLARRRAMAILLITHDLGVVAELVDRVTVMYTGRVVEQATGRGAVPRAAASLHARAVRLDAAHGGRDRTPAGDRRHGTGRRSAAAGMHLPSALSPGRRGVRTARAAPARHRRRPPGPLPPVRRPRAAPGSRRTCRAGSGGAVSGTAHERPPAARAAPSGGRALLQVIDLVKYFPVMGGFPRRVVGNIKAVDGISFALGQGETLGLVGESGCGKSTAGRTILRLYEPTGGSVLFRGEPIFELPRAQLRMLRRHLQIVFQDPISSLDPRKRVRAILADPLSVHRLATGPARERRIDELLQQVGLSVTQRNRYPHEFSGGQRQRIGIARALASEPEAVICDEPVSSLDVSIQAQIINLLADLQRELNLSYLFISHNLSVIRHICDWVAVMYLGRIVELAPKALLFTRPLHPYTEALLAAVPNTDPAARTGQPPLEGDVPSPMDPPPGCRFHTRCPLATDLCKQQDPALTPRAGADHLVACHHR